ncbi:MAG: GLUG motif-containing protein [Rikenellaceae bacterium]
MKKYYIYMVLAALTIVGCQNDPAVELSAVGSNSLLVSLPSEDDVASRVTFTDGESSVALAWESNDTFAVYTADGAYTALYQYSAVNGSNEVLFTTVGSVSLVGGQEYVAIYPAPEGTQQTSLTLEEYRTAVTTSILYQSQVGDNDKSHYNDYMLMEAPFTFVADADNAITFEHQMAAIRLTFSTYGDSAPTQIVFDDGDEASYTLYLSGTSDAGTYTANYVIYPNENGTEREVSFTMSYDDGQITSISAMTEAVYSAGVQYRSELSADNIILTEIYDLEELEAFAASVNAGNTAASCKLMKDIDLKGDEDNQWTPIGTNDARYAGTFDGNGFTISGLYINSPDQGLALIRYTDGATIKNLTVEAQITATENETAAAIVGYSYNSTISNCSTTENTVINGVGNNVAGIAGSLLESGSIDNCTNYATIIGSRNAGGITGFTNNSSITISNTVNYGSVSDTNRTSDKQSQIGGIVGYNVTKITNCHNYGAVTATGDAEFVAGIAGYAYDGSVLSGCSNHGTIISDYHSCGGIAGRIYRSYSGVGSYVINCYNAGKISTTGSLYIGGVVGDACKGTIVSCYSIADVVGTSKVGGIVGWNWYSSTVTGCYSVCTSLSSYSTTSRGTIVADNDATLSYCYSDSDVCSDALIGDEADGTSTGCAAFSTLYMQSETLVELLNNAAYLYNSSNPTYKAYGWAYNEGGYPVLDPTVEPAAREAMRYEISSAEELAKIGNDAFYLSCDDYVLTSNIDLKNVSWTPLPEFTGTFDGDSYTISGLKIDASHGTSYDYGLFKIVSTGGVVKNLTVEGEIDLSSVSGLQSVGLIAGYLNTATLENCEVSGSINTLDSKYIGGVVGYVNNSSSLDNCHSSATITNSSDTLDESTEARVGGVVGYLYSSSVINCSNSGELYSDFKHTGGIAGRLEGGATLSNSYNTGDVYSYVRAGGLIGCSVSSYMDNCYNTGTVTSDTDYGTITENGYEYSDLRGGLIGETWNVQYIQNSYFLSSCVDPSKAVGLDQFTTFYIDNNNSKNWNEGGYLTYGSLEDEAMKAASFVETLNANADKISGATTWIADPDGGYPVLE